MDLIMVLRAIIALPIIFFIPGYVTFAAFKVSKIENLKSSFFETIFLQVLTSIVITGWIAFMLAMLGYFSLWTLVGLLLIYSVIIAIKFRVKFSLLRFPKPRLDKQSLFLVFLVILTVSLFFHPFECITLHRDAGILVNTGVSIAKNGTFVHHDSIIENMPASVRPVFYEIYGTTNEVYGLQFPLHSLYITNAEIGEVTPGFFPLYPVWVATFYSLFGLKGALYATPFFALLGVLSVYLLGKTLFDWRVGLISSFLLSTNFIQLFFARFPSSDILFQFLVTSGFFVFILFYKTNSDLLGVVSAFCFGSAFLTKLDSFLLFVPLLICGICFLFISGKKLKVKAFFIPLAFVSSACLIYVFKFAPAYVFPILSGVKQEEIIGEVGFIDKNNLIANINRLVAYLSKPGLVLALLGFMFAVFKNKKKVPLYLFLGTGLIYTIFFIRNIHNFPIEPWCMRRYVGVVIPFLIICMGYMVIFLGGFWSGSFSGKCVLVLLVCSLILFNVVTIGPLVPYVGFRGLIDRAEEFAGYFDGKSIVIFHNDFQKTTLSLPLKYIFQKDSILLPKEPVSEKDIEIYDSMCDYWMKEKRDVYLVNPSDKFLQEICRVGDKQYDIVDIFTTSVPHLKPTFGFPNEIYTLRRELKIYRLIDAKK